MSESLTPSDARIKVMRHLEALFNEILEEDSESRSPAQATEDEQFATDLSLEVLDTLGLQVTAVDDDGSMTVTLKLEE
jgi:hypothetical protein